MLLRFRVVVYHHHIDIKNEHSRSLCTAIVSKSQQSRTRMLFSSKQSFESSNPRFLPGWQEIRTEHSQAYQSVVWILRNIYNGTQNSVCALCSPHQQKLPDSLLLDSNTSTLCRNYFFRFHDICLDRLLQLCREKNIPTLYCPVFSHY